MINKITEKANADDNTEINITMTMTELESIAKYKRLWETLKAHYAGSCLKDASYDEIYSLMETMEHE